MKESEGKEADEVHLPRTTPAWVLGLAEQGNGTEPCFIMSKTLTSTDLDAEQNRLLIPAAFVRAHLIPFLSDEERATTNLVDQERKRKKPSLHGQWSKKIMKPGESGGTGVKDEGEGEISKGMKKEAGRKHGGLRVPVYVGPSLWKAYVILIRWDSSNGTILKGDEYTKYLIRWSGVKVGDKVELWGFRDGETGMPCFVLHRTEETAATQGTSGGGGPSITEEEDAMQGTGGGVVPSITEKEAVTQGTGGGGGPFVTEEEAVIHGTESGGEPSITEEKDVT